MKITWALLIALSVLCFGFSAHALDDPKVARAKYEELAAKVRSGDMTVNWQALRLAAEVGGGEGDYDLQDANNRGIKAFNEGDFTGSLEIANEMLKHNIASGDAHFLAMISLKHLGRQADSDKEHAMLDAIFASIMDSGDGKTAKTAWFTVNVHEEYLHRNHGQSDQGKRQEKIIVRLYFLPKTSPMRRIWAPTLRSFSSKCS
jgi:hypothetical protein